MERARLTFFVELEAPALDRLLGQTHVIAGLRRRGAAISMAMLDRSPARASAMRTLAEAGVPVTAWILADPADGYWLGVDNAAKAGECYRRVRDWAIAERLQIETIGLDIELPRADAVSLANHGLRALRRMARRRRTRRRVSQATEQYARLVGEIRRDGFLVETYQLPLIVDERLARSTAIQRTFGLVDVVSDREVLMLYRSYLPRLLGPAVVNAYGANADAIAVGVTGGGVEELLCDDGQHLDFEQVLIDLRRARRYTDELYIFSLEGCVASGYFERLIDADLEQVARPALAAVVTPLLRSAFRRLLRTEPLWDRLDPQD